MRERARAHWGQQGVAAYAPMPPGDAPWWGGGRESHWGGILFGDPRAPWAPLRGPVDPRRNRAGAARGLWEPPGAAGHRGSLGGTAFGGLLGASRAPCKPRKISGRWRAPPGTPLEPRGLWRSWDSGSRADMGGMLAEPRGDPRGIPGRPRGIPEGFGDPPAPQYPRGNRTGALQGP